MNKIVFSLQEVFDGKFFQVPKYQRGYAWGEEQCNDLIDDIEVLGDNFYHYTGTLVLLERDRTESCTDRLQYKEHEIVDGQQRLTSIVLLLNAIVNELKSGDERKQKLASKLQKEYIWTYRAEDEQPLMKLRLNQETDNFFRQYLLKNAKSVKGHDYYAQKRITNAGKIFTELIKTKKKSLSNTEFDQWLGKIIHKITHQLRFTVYPVDSTAEVGVIFEVMNDRGKELTEFEKVKNYLMYLSTKLEIPSYTELEDNINNTWSEIFKRLHNAGLSSDSEDQLLRSHWFMAYDPDKKMWDGSKSVKKHFSLKNYKGDHKNLHEEILEYITTLGEASVAFIDLERPDHHDAFKSIENRADRESARRWSLKLQSNNTLASFRPLAIACRMIYREQGKEYAQLLELLEKFAFRVYGLAEKRADTGQSQLFRTAYDLYAKKLSFGELILRVKQIIHYYSDDISFNHFWEFLEGEDWYNWDSLKYMLYEYEEHLAQDFHVRPKKDWDYFKNKPLKESIEHILPQTRTTYWRDRFKIRDHRDYLHDLGNLCLTINNSSYSNNDFPQKKGRQNQKQPCYATSDLKQENELTKYRDWTKKEILKRRKKIVEWAKERWRVDFSDLDNYDERGEIEDLTENGVNE